MFFIRSSDRRPEKPRREQPAQKPENLTQIRERAFKLSADFSENTRKGRKFKSGLKAAKSAWLKNYPDPEELLSYSPLPDGKGWEVVNKSKIVKNHRFQLNIALNEICSSQENRNLEFFFESLLYRFQLY